MVPPGGGPGAPEELAALIVNVCCRQSDQIEFLRSRVRALTEGLAEIERQTRLSALSVTLAARALLSGDPQVAPSTGVATTEVNPQPEGDANHA